MSVKVARISETACEIDHIAVRLQAMYSDDGCGTPSISIEFSDAYSIAGLHAGFHGTTSEFRELARQLIEHCDAADRAQADAAEARAEARESA